MSEYQYYEFQAVDRPLTAREMGELRKYSTRARITPTSFVNDYEWGNFKGDEHAWMEKYFDAFLYVANWGRHVLALRLPSTLLRPATARQYCGGASARVRDKDGKVILTFVSENEGGDEWVEYEGQLSSVISVRAELARGDLRAMYLGWLLRVQADGLNDDDVEPPVPAGLGELSASLQSLVAFLRIDADLLHAAAEPSPALRVAGPDPKETRAWVRQLDVKRKDELITSLIMDAEHACVSRLRQTFLESRSNEATRSSGRRRTVGQLLRAAAERTEERGRIEADRRAAEEARREREVAVAREKHLAGLAGREPKLWAEVDTLIRTKQPKRYDQAVSILLDLRDVAAGRSGADFGPRLKALRQAHSHKPTFVARLRKAGL